MESPLVSICCITYNHEDYIRDAIEGFLMQETSFPIEIIIHDDASTDNTQRVIKEYVQKDDRIVTILREENIKSTGVPVFPITFQKARGKYIALCEGDDYWTDPNKLQKQVEVLENYENVSICFHSACELDCETGRKNVICNHLNYDGIVSTKSVIVNRGSYIPTASILFRNENYKQLYEFMQFAPVGDFFIQSYLALIGDVYYIDMLGCVYRRNSKNSWTLSQRTSTNKASHYKSMFKSINRFYLLNANKRNVEYLLKPLVYYLIKYVYSHKTPKKKIKEFYKAIQSLEYISISHISLELLKQLYIKF